VTARILADHFERVVIVDPEIEDEEKPKTRIIQYTATHGEPPPSSDKIASITTFYPVLLSLFVHGARRPWPNFDSEVLAASGR